MENPYRYRESDVSLHDAQIREAHNHRHFAWAEGYGKAKTEQAEIVGELVEALRDARDFTHYTLCTVPSCTCPEKDQLIIKLDTAIAKAKRNDDEVD